MLVNVGFATGPLQEKLWNRLSERAQELGLELVLQTQADSLYFSESTENPKVLTLVGPTGEFPCEDFTDQSLRLLLLWHRERVMLEGLRIHRHTLGNLIVIFMSRVLRLGDKIEATENEALMKLHARLTELYGEFEKINVSRSNRPVKKNA